MSKTCNVCLSMNRDNAVTCYKCGKRFISVKKESTSKRSVRRESKTTGRRQC